MRTLILALVFGSFFFSPILSAQHRPAKVSPTSNIRDPEVLQREDPIVQKIAKPIEFNWEKGTLEGALKTIGKAIGHGFEFDDSLTGEAIVDVNGKVLHVPVKRFKTSIDKRSSLTQSLKTLRVIHRSNRAEPLWYVLDSLTRRLQLGWSIRNNKILITEYKDAEWHRFERVFDVGELVKIHVRKHHVDGDVLVRDHVQYDHDHYIQLISKLIAPDSWKLDGTSIYGTGNALVVRQNWRVQIQIEQLLDGLRICHRLHGKNVEERDEQSAVELMQPLVAACDVRVYPIRKIVTALDDDPKQSYQALNQLVMNFVNIESWDLNGGPGSLASIERFGAMVIVQTPQMQERVKAFLSDLQQDVGTQTRFVHETPAMNQIRRLLERPIGRWKPSQQPLDKFLREISETYALPIQVDPEAEHQTDNEISIKLENLPVSLALTHLLRSADLAWTIHDDQLLVTTDEALESKLLTRIYPAAELLKMENEADKGKFAFGSLRECIMCLVAPESWDELGGLGQVVATKNALVISQTYKEHQLIEKLLKRLEQMREQLDKPDPKQSGKPFWLNDNLASPEADRIRAVLNSKVTFDFEDMRLEDLALSISREFEITVLLDRPALDEIGVGVDEPLTSSLKDLRLKTALNYLLNDLGVMWTILDNVLLLTSEDDDDHNMATAVYPVAEILGVDITDKKADLSSQWTGYSNLVNLIMMTVRPDMWDEWGGPGTASAFPIAGSIVIYNTQEIHERIEELLAVLQQTRNEYIEWDGYSPMPSVKFHGSSDNAPNQKMQKILDRSARLECVEQPLSNITNWLSKEHGITIALDQVSLEEVGIDGDTPLTMKAHKVSLRSLLNLISRDLELTYQFADDAIIITTPEVADENLILGFYPVVDILTWGNVASREEPDTWDYDTMIELISTSCCPENWEDVGGYGQLNPLESCGCIVISQSLEGHEQITSLLDSIRAWQQKYDQRMGVAMTDSFRNGKAGDLDDKIYRRLMAKRTSIAFKEQSLSKAMDSIANGYGFNIHLDYSINDVGVDEDTPFSGAVYDQPLGDCLRELLRPLDLNWVVRDESIVITSTEEAEFEMVTRLYPIADLGPSVGERGWRDVANELGLSLSNQIMNEVDESSWDEAGGSGVINSLAIPSVLVVSQSFEVHEKLERWLAEHRETEKKKAGRRE